MKKTTKKLQLKKETVRDLTSEQLAKAAGGFTGIICTLTQADTCQYTCDGPTCDLFSCLNPCYTEARTCAC